MLKAIPVLAVAAGLGYVAQAAPIQVSYDSFEDPDISADADGSTDDNATGWFEVGHPNTSGVIHENSGKFTTPYGSQALRAWQGQQTGAQKTLGENLEADMEYVLSFNVSARDNRSTGDYRAELWAGSTLLDLVEGTVTTNDMSHSVTHTFDTSAGTVGDALLLRLIDPSSGQVTNAWQDGPYFDNVLLTKELVPEPSSLALLGLGGLLIVRRRR